MKVLWVSSFPKNGIGHKVFLEKQLTEMAEKTMTVDIFSTGSLYSVMKFLTTRRRLKELAQNYDLVHAQWGSGCGFLVSTIPGIKVITLRGSDWYGSGGVGKLPNRFREFIGSLLTKVSLRKFSQVIVVSNRMSDEVSKIVNRSYLSCIPTAIDLDDVKPVSNKQALKTLGLKEKAGPYVLFVSSAHNYPVKRRFLAYSAFVRVKQFIPNAQFIEITDRPRKEIFAYMSLSDVLLITSIHEGWPNVVKEALACNLPFVSTDVSDLRLIAQNTENCFVADATEEALANAIVKCLQSGPQPNLRKFVKNMSLSITASQTLRVYKKALSR